MQLLQLYKAKVLCPSLITHNAMKKYAQAKEMLQNSSPQHLIEVSGQLHAPATLLPEKEPPLHIAEEDGWAHELVWPS
jgi:hypothetical protein